MIDKTKVKILPYELDNSINQNEIYERLSTILFKIKKESIENNEDIIGREDRVVASEILQLITYNGHDVGFIYATVEQRYKDGLFIDMALLKKARGNGIGRIALEKISNNYADNKFLIGEAKKENVASNIISEICGAKIPFDNDEQIGFNYYIFPKTKLQEFLEHNKDNRFQKAMVHETQSSSTIINEIKNGKNKMY